MTRLARLSVLGLVLVAVGCNTCDDRPRLFPRLRGAFDRDDDDRLRDRLHRNHEEDRLAAAPRPVPNGLASAAGCVPCAGLGGVPSGSTLGYGGGVVGMPMVYSGGAPALGTPVMPGGGGVVIPGGTYTPRDNELPPPGGWSQPRSEDMGRTVPRPPAGFTGSGR